MTELGLVLWITDRLREVQQTRRRVKVLVHRAYFRGGNIPHLFVKVTNLSATRETEITHVWFEVDPRVDVVLPDRPLPARLRPDETWEGWAEITGPLAGINDAERLARVRLPNGKVVKSRPNKDVPPVGYVGGSGSR